MEEYSNDEEVFLKDFATAFAKLLDLGVPHAEPMSSVNLGVGGTIRWFHKLLGKTD